MINTIFWAIVVLGVLIFVHELGHFLVARLAGVRVLVFSLGFGPRIGGWQSADSRTEYQVSAIPLGGYVKMLGEGDDEDEEILPEETDQAFSNKGVWTRFAIVSAGPAFNFIFAVFALMIAFMSGVGELLPVVGTLSPGMPAEAAGLRTGDRITHIGERPINRWETLSNTIKNSDSGPITLTVERDDTLIRMTVTPRIKEVHNLFGEPVRMPLIGISPEGATEEVFYGPWESLVKGLEQTYSMTTLTLTSVWKLLNRTISADQIGGPLMIADLAGKTASQGASSLLYFMALISVNLGILNLLPIPILDGGHLLFFLIEAAKGQPVREKFQMMANRVGMTLLLLLMVWALKNDLVRMFPPGP